MPEPKISEEELVRSVLIFGTGYQWRHPSGKTFVLDPTEVYVFMPFDTPPTAAELAARLAEVEAERDAARAELEAARPVVEAAVAWREQLGGSREVMVFGHLVGAQSKAMIAAVDLYRSATTRNLDSALPDPSLDAETLPTEEKP